MTTNQQMNHARREVRHAMRTNQDRSHLHQVAINALLSVGIVESIVSEMATCAMLDVTCGK